MIVSVTDPGAIIETVERVAANGDTTVKVKKTQILEEETINKIENKQAIDRLDKHKGKEISEEQIESVSAKELNSAPVTNGLTDKEQDDESTGIVHHII